MTPTVKRIINPQKVEEFRGEFFDRSADEIERGNKEAVIDGVMPTYSFSLLDLLEVANISLLPALKNDPISVVYAVSEALGTLTHNLDWISKQHINEVPEGWITSTRKRAERWFEPLSHKDFPMPSKPSTEDSNRWPVRKWRTLRNVVTKAWIQRSKAVWQWIVNKAAEQEPELYARYKLATLDSYRSQQYYCGSITGQKSNQIRPSATHQALFGGGSSPASREDNPTQIPNIPGGLVCWYTHYYDGPGKNYDTINTIYLPENWEGNMKEAKNWVDYVNSVKLLLEEDALKSITPDKVIKKPIWGGLKGGYTQDYNDAIKWVTDTPIVSIAKGEKLPILHGEKSVEVSYRVSSLI